MLEIGRANRPDLYNLYYIKPKPFVPRYLRLEVRGRMNFKGEELEPLQRGRCVAGRRILSARKVWKRLPSASSIPMPMPPTKLDAPNSSANLAPDIPVTASHELTQEWREYERTNTAVLNSFVQPTVQDYLGSLEKQLAGLGMGQGLSHHAVQRRHCYL